MNIPKIKDDETWVNVLDYENLYLVSNYGRIYSLISKKIRKEVIHKNGYAQVMLSKNKKLKLISVHRVVMMSFNYKSELEVDHINNVKNDNRLINLRYCTRLENESFKVRKNKASKYKGVRILNNKWAWMITIQGKTKHLGTYNTEEQAYKAYLTAFNNNQKNI